MKLKELKNVIFTELTIIDVVSENGSNEYNNVVVFDDKSIFNTLSEKEIIGIRTRIKEIGSYAYSYLEILVK